MADLVSHMEATSVKTQGTCFTSFIEVLRKMDLYNILGRIFTWHFTFTRSHPDEYWIIQRSLELSLANTFVFQTQPFLNSTKTETSGFSLKCCWFIHCGTTLA